MEKELEQLKAKNAVYEKAHNIVTEYLMALDEKLDAGINGMDAKQVAELKIIIDQQSKRLSIVATELSEL